MKYALLPLETKHLWTLLLTSLLLARRGRVVYEGAYDGYENAVKVMVTTLMISVLSKVMIQEGSGGSSNSSLCSGHCGGEWASKITVVTL